MFTLSNAVEHERGWVARKMGLFDMFEADDDRNEEEASREVAKRFSESTYAQ